PLWALIAAAIRVSSPGPVFYRQVRCGLHGRRFTLLKFRTMTADAEARLRREASFDPDIWIVEIEDRQCRPFVDLA
ncbi:MAG: DUF1491 family protein, partial [Methylocystis sp.]|nr:DUF1491 family protein [Methylocystis sp.]